MNFAFSDEQEELRAAVRRFLSEKSPETEVRRLMDTTEGYDPAVWSQMADQLGLQSLTIPEEFGGSGFSYVELLVVLEEMGAALLCAPFFSSVALGANALLTSGDDEAKKSYLPGIASGETIATLAITEDNGQSGTSAAIECQASKSSDGWALEGHKMFVLDGHVANLIVVAAKLHRGRACPCSRYRVTRRGSRARRSRRWTRPASRRASNSPPRPRSSSAPTAAPRPGWPRRSTSPRWRSPRNRSAARNACSMRRSTTPRAASSSAGRSAASRPSSTSVRTCCSRLSLRSRPPTTPVGPPLRTPTSSRSSRALRSPSARRRTSTPRPRTSRSTAASVSPGSTRAHLYFKRAKSSELFLGDPSYHRELLAQRIGI